jgi:hypothetical protein
VILVGDARLCGEDAEKVVETRQPEVGLDRCVMVSGVMVAVIAATTVTLGVSRFTGDATP